MSKTFEELKDQPIVLGAFNEETNAEYVLGIAESYENLNNLLKKVTFIECVYLQLLIRNFKTSIPESFISRLQGEEERLKAENEQRLISIAENEWGISYENWTDEVKSRYDFARRCDNFSEMIKEKTSEVSLISQASDVDTVVERSV